MYNFVDGEEGVVFLRLVVASVSFTELERDLQGSFEPLASLARHPWSKRKGFLTV